MFTEFLVRYSKKIKNEELSDEDKAVIQSRRILDEDYDSSKDEKLIKHSYDYAIINLKDVSDIIRIDKDHSQILKYNNTAFVVRTPYESLKQLFTQITGNAIVVIEQKDSFEQDLLDE